MLPEPFTWDGDHIAVDLGAGARALFTTRRGGVSAAPYDSLNLGLLTEDDPAHVEENRRRVAGLAGVPVFGARQVHGTGVSIPTRAAREEADAVVIEGEGRAALVLTADCLPIAVATEHAVAMVHAGWKGLAEGVIEAALDALAPGVPVVAAIGPSAGGCCYEVGDDVRSALGEEPVGAPRTIDLRAIAARRLRAGGVATVHDVDLCTMCTAPDLFFSHRRDGPATGRQGGIAWRPNP